MAARRMTYQATCISLDGRPTVRLMQDEYLIGYFEDFDFRDQFGRRIDLADVEVMG